MFSAWVFWMSTLRVAGERADVDVADGRGDMAFAARELLHAHVGLAADGVDQRLGLLRAAAQ